MRVLCSDLPVTATRASSEPLASSATSPSPQSHQQQPQKQKPLAQLSTKELCDWLEQQGLGEYASKFEENAITG